MTLSQAHKPICLDRARIPERRARTRKSRGILLIINHAHVAHVLAVKAEREGECPDTNGPGLFRGRAGS